MRLSVVHSRLIALGGVCRVIGQQITGPDPGQRYDPDVYTLPNDTFVYVVSVGPAEGIPGDYTVVRIMVGKVKIDDPPHDTFVGILIQRDELLEHAKEVTLSEEGLVDFVPYERATTRSGS
jgi:hypothetical protein